jgi:small subunit ribosomal protein S9
MTEDKKTTEKFTGQYYEATGRRKTAVARVRLYNDKKGRIIINDQDYTKYIPLAILRDRVKFPLKTTGHDDFSVSAKVAGGGPAGQADAVTHGIARALLKFDKELRASLKPLGVITRDPRRKERKKPGLKKARKSAQWSKR